MRNRAEDLTGRTYGRFKVLGLDDVRSARKKYWMCECECGTIKSVRSDSLKAGKIRSCGCLKSEHNEINLDRTTHGRTGSRMYGMWQGMRKRCTDVSSECYERYGGRGIQVCDEWDRSFEAFHSWAMQNGYSEELTIDRIDNDGNYGPRNCRFATAKEQSNNRRSNIVIEAVGSEYTLTQACEILKLPYSTIRARHERGIRGLELFKPVRPIGQYRDNQEK